MGSDRRLMSMPGPRSLRHADHDLLGFSREERLINSNPVPKLASVRRFTKHLRKLSKPLAVEEVQRFLDQLPARVEMAGNVYVSGQTLRDLYHLWFRTGWRSNEIVALRFDWLSASRQVVELRKGRAPRVGRTRGRTKDRRAGGRVRLRPDHFRDVRTSPPGKSRARRARLRLHRFHRPPPLARVACETGLAPDATDDRVERSGAVQHPRHLHQPGALGRRRPRLGGAGVRHLRADDLPALPKIHGELEAPRRQADRRFVQRPGHVLAPDWHRRGFGGRKYAKSNERKSGRGESLRRHNSLFCRILTQPSLVCCPQSCPHEHEPIFGARGSTTRTSWRTKVAGRRDEVPGGVDAIQKRCSAPAKCRFRLAHTCSTRSAPYLRTRPSCAWMRCMRVLGSGPSSTRAAKRRSVAALMRAYSWNKWTSRSAQTRCQVRSASTARRFV